MKTDSNSNTIPHLPGLGGALGVSEEVAGLKQQDTVAGLLSGHIQQQQSPVITPITPVTSPSMNGQPPSNNLIGPQGGAMTSQTGTTPNTTPNNNTANNTRTTGPVKSCAGCGARIADRFLLHAMDRYWHTNCLKCSCCQAQLGEIGTSCFAKAGMILCKNDYVR